MDVEKQSIRSKKRKELLVQVLFGLIANIVNIAPGMSLGFSAVALPSLQNSNATFHVNEEEASWIAGGFIELSLSSLNRFLFFIFGPIDSHSLTENFPENTSSPQELLDLILENISIVRNRDINQESFCSRPVVDNDIWFVGPDGTIRHDRHIVHHCSSVDVSSIASISTPLGCIVTGAILDRFGRKLTLLAVNFPCLLGWLLIAFANGDATLFMIYAGRFFTGLATGMGSVPATVYSAEMSSESLRGMFVTWTSISISMGIFFVYVLGYVLQDNWKMVAGASALFPACAIILVYFFLPESPPWLLSKGKSTKAEQCMKKVRGVTPTDDLPLTIANEFDRMNEKFKNKPNDKNNTNKKNIFKLFFRKGTIKPFIIMNLFFFFQQFSGIFVIIFYAVKVVEEAKIPWDPFLVAILIGLTRVLVTIFMSFLSKKYGRRPPSIVSGAGMTICMGCLAIFLYLQKTNKISEETAKTLGWVPVTSLILYILTSTIGFLTLPWAMIGEVFPSEVRGLAAGLTTCIAYIFNFIIVKVYPEMVVTLYEYGVFFFYGAFSVIGTAFVVLFLPETQGKTLLEIEEYFNKKKKSKKVNLADENGELIINSGPVPTIVPKKS